MAFASPPSLMSTLMFDRLSPGLNILKYAACESPKTFVGDAKLVMLAVDKLGEPRFPKTANARMGAVPVETVIVCPAGSLDEMSLFPVSLSSQEDTGWLGRTTKTPQVSHEPALMPVTVVSEPLSIFAERFILSSSEPADRRSVKPDGVTDAGTEPTVRPTLWIRHISPAAIDPEAPMLMVVPLPSLSPTNTS